MSLQVADWRLDFEVMDAEALDDSLGKAALDVQGLVLAAIHAAERGIADPMEPSELKLVLDTQVLFTQSNAKSKP